MFLPSPHPLFVTLGLLMSAVVFTFLLTLYTPQHSLLFMFFTHPSVATILVTQMLVLSLLPRTLILYLLPIFQDFLSIATLSTFLQIFEAFFKTLHLEYTFISPQKGFFSFIFFIKTHLYLISVWNNRSVKQDHRNFCLYILKQKLQDTLS